MDFRFNKTIKNHKSSESEFLTHNPILKTLETEEISMVSAFKRKNVHMYSLSYGKWKALGAIVSTAAIVGIYKAYVIGDSIKADKLKKNDENMLEKEGTMMLDSQVKP
ncbi:unnamed protein product [Blepharisma stoltei]|uniref:Transmembrane protein n=1 Tax=Blepharisma stoltei TaxID=1481888 RepID=A0AAU9JDI9_9CILI|nr:unnamed protein product [Blepharisma stoltei]